MLTRQILPGTDLAVSALCAGAGSYGTSLQGDDLARLYLAFREAGGNFFDTAHCYGFWGAEGAGASERALGALVRRHDRREEVVLATKGGHPAVEPGYPRPDGYLAPEVIERDVADSLEQLGVEQIDLYYLHRDDSRVPVDEIIDCLNGQIARGRLCWLGASNWSLPRLAAANAYAAARGLRGFAAMQSQWNLAQTNLVPTADPTVRAVTPEEIPWYREHRFPVIPYSPTACGYFATGGQSGTEQFDNPASRRRLQCAEALAMELGCSPNQVALAWLLAQEFPVVPIVGTASVAHLRDALGAVTVSLTPEQRDWLAAA